MTRYRGKARRRKSLHDPQSWIFSFLSASNSGKFTAREFSLGRLASGLLQPCCLLLCFAFLRAQFNPGKLYSTFFHGFAVRDLTDPPTIDSSSKRWTTKDCSALMVDIRWGERQLLKQQRNQMSGRLIFCRNYTSSAASHSQYWCPFHRSELEAFSRWQ